MVLEAISGSKIWTTEKDELIEKQGEENSREALSCAEVLKLKVLEEFSVWPEEENRGKKVENQPETWREASKEAFVEQTEEHVFVLIRGVAHLASILFFLPFYWILLILLFKGIFPQNIQICSDLIYL